MKLGPAGPQGRREEVRCLGRDGGGDPGVLIVWHQERMSGSGEMGELP